jgi:hypothetical protein
MITLNDLKNQYYHIINSTDMIDICETIEVPKNKVGGTISAWSNEGWFFDGTFESNMLSGNIGLIFRGVIVSEKTFEETQENPMVWKNTYIDHCGKGCGIFII